MPKVPERKLSLGEIIENKKRASLQSKKEKRPTTVWVKVGELWYKQVPIGEAKKVVY